MNNKNLFQIILLLFIGTNLQNNSCIIRFNVAIWSIMLFFPKPLVLHIAHLIGAFQIVTGWLWFKPDCIPLYILSLSMVWILLLIKKECLVNQIIEEENQTYQIGFSNTQALLGLPILCILASRRYFENNTLFNIQ